MKQYVQGSHQTRNNGRPRTPRRSRLMPESAQSESSSTAIEAALSALREGELVIVLDAKERENEGDLICAAETITPEMVDFMLRQGAGEMCAPMTREVADRLKLPLMVDPESNTSLHQTPFLLPVDHCDSGTGVSADARAVTIRALADDNSKSTDFVRPGHMHPLLAREGGVLRRAGHTEATIDLMKLAGCTPVGCLIEICSQRGHGMADDRRTPGFLSRAQYPARQHRRHHPAPPSPRATGSS